MVYIKRRAQRKAVAGCMDTASFVLAQIAQGVGLGGVSVTSLALQPLLRRSVSK